jgi:hypothetical protein
MLKIDKKQFSMKKDGVFIFYSEGCWTCEYYIEEFQKEMENFYIVDTSEDYNFYIEECGIELTPTTIVYKDDRPVWRKQGMLFDTQLEEMRKYL